MIKTPGGDREMVEILALLLQHDEQAVLAAVELAREAGAPTKTHILNSLHRLVDGKPTNAAPVKPPNALTLTTEPQANVERHDALRKAREARHAHNPAAGAIIIMAHAASKCTAWLRRIGELTEQGSPAFEAALPILSQLLRRRRTTGR